MSNKQILQSNNNTLTVNNLELQNCIDLINTLPKYDTCTVSINNRFGNLFGYCFTCFNGESIVYKYNFSANTLGDVTITDVICGSAFSIIQYTSSGIYAYNGVTKIGSIDDRGSIFIAPTQPGVTGTAQIGVVSHSGGSTD